MLLPLLLNLGMWDDETGQPATRRQIEEQHDAEEMMIIRAIANELMGTQ